MSEKISFNNIPVIIDTWQRDDTYEGVYPSGSRVKDSYFSPLVAENKHLKSNWRYLFKLSRTKFPWQFWCEIIAYRLGCIIGVKVPPAHIGLSRNYKKDSETHAALIEWFYDDKKEGYIPGGLMMESKIKNFDRRKGDKHNFKTIRELSEDNEEIVKYWANILTFDTLIGNLDRHQDNWGFIVRRTLNKIKEEDGLIITASPAFDNGTALGYEILEQNIDRYKGEQLQHYLMHKKAKHHIKWSLDENEQLNFTSL